MSVPKIPNVRNPNVLKSELAFVRILELSEIRTFGFQTFTVMAQDRKNLNMPSVGFIVKLVCMEHSTMDVGKK